MRGPNKKLTPFGKLVVKALADQDMTKAELAAEVGVAPQYLSYTPTCLSSGTRIGEAARAVSSRTKGSSTAPSTTSPTRDRIPSLPIHPPCGRASETLSRSSLSGCSRSEHMTPMQMATR